MLISTSKNQKVGFYKKTFTGLGALNGYYYFFRLKSGSTLKLKAPGTSLWSIPIGSNVDVLNPNFDCSISLNGKFLNLNVKNIPKECLHLYDFLVKLDGINTFITFVMNWNYIGDYDKVYYNNKQITLINYEFYLGYADCIWYNVEYQNISPTFSTNETMKFTLNLLSLISIIEDNWKNNTNIYQKPHQSKVQQILNRLGTYTFEPTLPTLPQSQITWTVVPPLLLSAK